VLVAKLIDRNGVERWAGDLIGGGSTSMVDLGVLSAPGLVNGPQTLYTPPAAQWIALALDPDDYVNIDNPFEADLTIGAIPFLIWSASQVLTDMIDRVAHRSPLVFSSPLVATGVTEQDGISITAALVDWQANHVYAQNALILRSGTIWAATTPGTSGGAPPNFAGAPNPGDTVADNTVTWTNEGLAPTTGSFHLYALVASL